MSSQLRARVPILEHAIPMNNCSQAPQTDATLAAAREYLESWNRDGMDWYRWMGEVFAARTEFAGLINAEPDEVAVVTSVSHATAIIASAMDFTNTRNGVVASGFEFPGVGHVWLAHERQGANVAWVPTTNDVLSPADYEPFINDQTRIVSAAHAYFLNGALQDVRGIAQLAHGRGAFLYVDAYQSAGIVPIDVKAMEVDFLSSGTLKFLMGTPGIAFLYVRRQLIERLEPTVTGWFGRVNPFAFGPIQLDWSPTASRFEEGTPSIFSGYVSRAGLRLLQEVGLDRVFARGRELGAYLQQEGEKLGLTVHGRTAPHGRTATTAFVVADAHAVEERMRKRGIIASARGPVVRLAPHFYSTTEDCDRALHALKQEMA